MEKKNRERKGGKYLEKKKGERERGKCLEKLIEKENRENVWRRRIFNQLQRERIEKEKEENI